jgi:Protein of unknown function (DUF3108)
MKTLFSRSIAILIVAVSVALGVIAQSAPPVDSARMFAGETLKYEGKMDKILHGISVADLSFNAIIPPNSNELLIRSEAVSKGTLLKLFRYSFLQQYDSTVDTKTFHILKTVKHDVQKERIRDSEAVFNYTDKRVTFVETDPKDPMRPPRRIASEIDSHMLDMISAIYALRALPLAVGQRHEFSVSDSGLVYKIPFLVTAREMQKTVLGKMWCLRIEPEIFGENRLIEQKGEMVIWVTDNDRHTPVRSQIKTQYGKFDIKLKSAAVMQ